LCAGLGGLVEGKLKNAVISYWITGQYTLIKTKHLRSDFAYVLATPGISQVEAERKSADKLDDCLVY